MVIYKSYRFLCPPEIQNGCLSWISLRLNPMGNLFKPLLGWNLIVNWYYLFCKWSLYRPLQKLGFYAHQKLKNGCHKLTWLNIEPSPYWKFVQISSILKLNCQLILFIVWMILVWVSTKVRFSCLSEIQGSCHRMTLLKYSFMVN